MEADQIRKTLPFADLLVLTNVRNRRFALGGFSMALLSKLAVLDRHRAPLDSRLKENSYFLLFSGVSPFREKGTNGNDTPVEIDAASSCGFAAAWHVRQGADHP